MPRAGSSRLKISRPAWSGTGTDQRADDSNARGGAEEDGYRPARPDRGAGPRPGQGLADLKPEGFETIVPYVTIEVEAAGRHNDLLVEIDRSRRAVKENNQAAS